jgi:broad specificity phosphatase PhoE
MTIGRIYLIRHGQTTGNSNHYVGWDDLPLNEIGVQQAHRIDLRLDSIPISEIYCSPLMRAVATARPLSESKGLELMRYDNLKEINYGEYQGRLKSELNLKLRKDYRYEPLPGGESLHDVYKRVRQFKDGIAESFIRNKPIAIIAHFWSIRMLLGVLQGLSFDSIFIPGGYKPGNGSIYEVQYHTDKYGKLVCLAQAYLEPLDQENWYS